MYKKINTTNSKGFSLVEMLVAVAIFMSIMTIAISSLVSIINANKKAQSIKSTVDSVTFALENISRDMRMGTNYQCLTSTGAQGSSKDCSSGSSVVGYINSSGYFVIYKFSTSTGASSLKISTCPDSEGGFCSIASAKTEDLISEDTNVNITNMNFYVIGSQCEDGLAPCSARTQPRVVITASGLITAKGSEPTSFNLQTNISQRARF